MVYMSLGGGLGSSARRRGRCGLWRLFVFAGNSRSDPGHVLRGDACTCGGMLRALNGGEREIWHAMGWGGIDFDGA